ncbi:MAG: hypothetical protein ACUVX8_16850 [Candidatus Zipacnadales bacterium]
MLHCETFIGMGAPFCTAEVEFGVGKLVAAVTAFADCVGLEELHGSFAGWARDFVNVLGAPKTEILARAL